MAQVYEEEKLKKKLQHMEVGDTFITKPAILTPWLVESFIRLMGLNHRIFLSDEFAQSYGFKSRISTGLLTFSYMMGMLFDAGALADGVYVGTDKCRHMHPVYPGDTITAEVEILAKRVTSKGDSSIIQYSWKVRNQNDQIVSAGENT